MKFISVFALSVIVLASGCKSVDVDKGGSPIVSPSHISSDKQGADAPQFPSWYTPWWKSVNE